jgi:Amt family ammonium transporter
VWTTLVYDMVAHWAWSFWTEYDENGEPVAAGGWLHNLGVLDYAGGTVIHITSGVSAAVAAIIVGKRDSLHGEKSTNSSWVLLGGSLLWFGWFGFNSGSSLGAGANGALAFINTQIAAGSGFMTFLFLEYIVHKKTTVIGAMSGAVVGLVAITPGAGFFEMAPSLAVGCFGNLGVFAFMEFKNRVIRKYLPQFDDTLDAFSAHGVGGMLGCGMVGFFCTSRVNSVVVNEGILYGGSGYQFAVQLASICATVLVSVIVTAVTLLLLRFTIGVRYHEQTVMRGLDALHGEDVGEIESIELGSVSE